MSSPPNSPASRPIPITAHHARARSGSLASIPALSTSPTSPVLGSLQTPNSITGFSARFTGAGPDSPTSPLGPASPLSYFLSGATSTSPSKNGFSLSSKPLSSSALDENEESSPPRSAVATFHRRASTTATNWGPGTVQSPGSGATNDRAAGVLRRFSLSGVLQRPNLGNGSPPKEPPRALAPAATVPIIIEPRPTRRSKGPKEPIKRGISPMGERLLKGHFDGFI
ncbi:hypothetical protein FRC03_005647 [Tulasnella sp. 419]|nr:hypothetical protein FRC02_010496 [Tulasnella sp. 418]KAG8961217.1 hypothetical protein FRC03_005647 [Tulasnella sp. 419]